jgi:hypothetical protein
VEGMEPMNLLYERSRERGTERSNDEEELNRAFGMVPVRWLCDKLRFTILESKGMLSIFPVKP